MDIMEKYARFRAARAMGLVKDPDGLNLPDELWQQHHIEGIEPFRFVYKNHRGEVGNRLVIPSHVRFGTNDYHTKPQWLMAAFDLDKWDFREFAMEDICPST